MPYFFKNHFYSWAIYRQTGMNSYYENQHCKFHDHVGWGSWVPVLAHSHIGHTEMYYFSENLLYSWVSCRQTEYRVMIRTEAYYRVIL